MTTRGEHLSTPMLDIAIPIAMAARYCDCYICMQSNGADWAARMRFGICEDDPAGNVQHIAEHGIRKEEVEEVLQNPDGVETSRSSGRPIAFGVTTTGRIIAVVYEVIDQDTV